MYNGERLRHGARLSKKNFNSEQALNGAEKNASDILLSVKDLHVSFSVQGGHVEAVKGISFDIKKGKTLALVGESGSGKSVIAQTIMRILPNNGSIDRGSVIFFDPEDANAPIETSAIPNGDSYLSHMRGGRISMVFQEPMTALSPLHTIGNQVEEALRLHHGKVGAEARLETEEILRLVGFPDPHRGYDMYSFELSGGLRQRAVIAMALICNPALVVADEPTTALDVTVQAQILALMKRLQDKFHMAILLITHDLGVVANMADEVVVAYHGKVMEAGSIDDIFRNPQHAYLKALMSAVPHFDMKPGERLVSLRDMDGEGTQAIRQVSARFKNEYMGDRNEAHLSVRNLRKEFTIRKGSWFGGGADSAMVAVNDVSFDIKHGECLGLVGESGSGKTTVAKLIMRALATTSGEANMKMAGKPVNILEMNNKELFEYRRKVQMIFQDPFGSLNPRMTVQNILREPYIIHEVGNAEGQTEEIIDLMNLVGLDPRFLNRYPHSFSGGQRQRIGIARALALHPELLICDEPVSALDVSVQAQVLNLLNDLRSELGLTSLFITHNLAVVNYVADRIAVMCRGRLVELASREEIFNNPTHPYTKTLLSSVPYPDLDRLLDFENLKRTNADDSSSWGGAFTASEDGALASIDIGDGHLVLANQNSDIRELTT
jgi:peptide/nickel transport system ATP-binding protein